jgi:Flp pilus assembly protein TadD
VVRSFLETFPQSVLWYNTSELLLIGTRADRFQINQARIQQGLAITSVNQDLEYSHWGGQHHWLNQPDVFLGGFLMGPQGLASLASNAQMYLDDRPVLDYETIGNYNNPTGELPLVEVLTSHLKPVSNLLTGESADLPGTVAETREKNLQEIAARVFIRQATDLIPSRNHAMIASFASQAVSQLPEHLGGHRMLAEALMQVGQIQGSSNHFQRVLDLDPKNGRALDGRAVTLHRLGQLDEAVGYYNQALELNANNARAMNGVAIALLRLGRPTEAIPHLQNLLRLMPDKFEINADLGAALAQVGRLREAQSHLERAVKYLPNHAGARRNLAQVRATLESGRAR